MLMEYILVQERPGVALRVDVRRCRNDPPISFEVLGVQKNEEILAEAGDVNKWRIEGVERGPEVDWRFGRGRDLVDELVVSFSEILSEVEV